MPSAIPPAVQQAPLFSGLSEQEKEALLSAGHARQIARGDHVFLHGDPVRSFYLVTNGTIQLYRQNPEGGEKTIDIVRPGQSLCESEVMDACHAHRAHARAVEDATVMEFPVGWLKEAAQKNGVFALNLLSLISQQAHLAELEAEQQSTMSAAQLVACFLQRLCVLHDFNPRGFDLPYSKTLIASRLGMELETFSRTLAKLKEHGIAVDGMHVAIHDLKRIEHYVCNVCSIAEDCPTHQAMERKSCGPTNCA